MLNDRRPSIRYGKMNRHLELKPHRTGHPEGANIMNEPASLGDERPLSANVEKQSPISSSKATEPTLVEKGNLSSLPFHVAIADGA